jgi:hypothetical protein
VYADEVDKTAVSLTVSVLAAVVADDPEDDAITKVEVVLSESELLVYDPASPLRLSETELPCGTINALVKLLKL